MWPLLGLTWWRLDTLRISGFVDDVMFASNRLADVWRLIEVNHHGGIEPGPEYIYDYLVGFVDMYFAVGVGGVAQW